MSVEQPMPWYDHAILVVLLILAVAIWERLGSIERLLKARGGQP